MSKLVYKNFFVVSLDFEGGGADTICYTKAHADAKGNDYLKECRLRQIKGCVTKRKVSVNDITDLTEQDFFDGVVDTTNETIIEKITIEFNN